MDSLQTRDAVMLGQRRWRLHRLDRLGVDHLPFTFKVLLENLLRHEDGRLVTAEQVAAVRRWDPTAERRDEVDLHPTRVFLHDTNGVPALVDLAAMRDALAGLGGDPEAVNPLIPAELVADHSVIADIFGRPGAALAAAPGFAQRDRRSRRRCPGGWLAVPAPSPWGRHALMGHHGFRAQRPAGRTGGGGDAGGGSRHRG